MVYSFFDKNSASLADKSAAGSGIKNESTKNHQLAENSHKSIMRKFKKEEFIHHLKTIFGVLI